MKFKKCAQSLVCLLLIPVRLLFSQSIPYDSLYLGETPPDNIPLLFAPGIVSINNRTENGITFSQDEKMCFFSVLGGATYFAEYNNGKWSLPISLNSKFGGEPFFPPDNNRVYLNSKQAVNRIGYSDISYADKNDTTWSDPISLGSPLNSTQGQWHPCIVADSSIYFSSNNGPICRSQFNNGAYAKPVFLPFPINGFTGDTWGDPYVSPYESYIIFRSGRSGGYGNIDIYISYKKDDGSWTNPKNLGNKINTSTEEFSGDISYDGKYFFYGRSGDIYWVKADFIDSLKATNFIPYNKNKIPAQNIFVNSSFDLPISDSVFIDDDGNETLTYSALLSNGDNLPSWLHFDPVLKIFSGIPDNVMTYNVKVTVTDNNNETASCIFKITVKELIINYLAQTPPGNNSIIFNTASEQKNRLESAGVFSRDGKEFYFSVVSSDWKTRNVYVRKYKNGVWTDEELTSFSSIPGGSTETFITKDNNYIIFPSGDGTTTTDGWLKTDFWITKRAGESWEPPRKLGAAINDIEVQWHPTISDSGHIYFGSKGAVFVADHINDTTYGSPVKLNDLKINKPGFANADPFISGDETYLIFSSNRSGGYGNTDIYISYKIDNIWTEPINLGPNINTSWTEYSSYVTPDGKYLLFCRENGNNTIRHLYWVSTNFIDSIKSTITGISKNNIDKIINYSLLQNYPNPFNPVTTITYSIPENEFVELKIFDILGNEAALLVNEFKIAGQYKIKFDGSNLTSGIYFCRIEAGAFMNIKKIILMK